jgi:inositol-phosphate phosphatase/L-galactose 1-phosphate phosphatase/histidinol-phosphatase
LAAARDPAATREIAAAAALALRLADAARAVIQGYFRRSYAIEDKADESPVTIADREAEAAMRRLIGENFPHHGIIGEEYGAERADAEFVWVLDPIDGTKSFICGVPLFGTLIALLHQGRRCASVAAATLFATAPEMFKGANKATWERVSGAVKLQRYGADCYAYGLLAAGFCDVIVEADLKPYDYCAQIPIIAGAGGLLTDWRGNPAGLGGDGRIIAAGDPVLHAEMVKLINQS